MSDKPASPARGRKKTAPPAQQPPQEEVVVRLPLADLYPFPDHPFQVRDDEEMRETIQSVKEYGVIVPAIVRPREEGGYEIVAGHRRKYACEQAGLDTMPVLIRNLDRDAATIIMVDSNLQRENILPSERAKAYKMKLEAIKRQGARNDLTSPKISAKLRSDDEIGQQMGVSGDTVRNYISLTNLVPELMQMVDEKKIALSPAYQIAALKPEEQQMIFAQRPDATACAEYDLWNDTMRRYVRRGSKGIALVDNSREKPRLRYVFDISDTGLRKNSRHPFLWELRPEHEAAVAQALAERFGTPPENNLAEQLESIAAQLVSEYWVEHKRDIHIRPTFSLTGQPPRMCRSCWDILM